MLKKDSPIFLQNINMIARQLFLLFKKSTTFWDNPRIVKFGLQGFNIIIPPGIYAEGFIVFVFPFVHLYVRLFVRS